MDDIGGTTSILRASGWPQRKLFDVAEFYRMADAGVLSGNSRIELIEGEILEMAPIGGRHIGAVMALTEIFVPASAGRFRVSVQNPLRLDDRSEPEPDLVLLRLRADRYRGDGPPVAANAALVLEVADSSLQFDKRVKMPLYARHGIAEFWLVDLEDASITVCRSPTHDGYASSETFRGRERIEALALPGVSIKVADVITN